MDERSDPAPPRIVLTKADSDVEVGEPFGTDSYFLLATSQPIPDPTIFNFEGVGEERTTSRGGSDPLSDLLSGMGSSHVVSRGLPTEWRIEWRPYRSVPKK